MASDSTNVILLSFPTSQADTKIRNTRKRSGTMVAFPAIESRPKLETVSHSRAVVVQSRRAQSIANLERGSFELEKIIAQIKKESDGGSRTIPKMCELLETLRCCISNLRD